ncbi:MAG: helix-turn-helix domain-containing protein [Candidatus Thiodiazotropha sp.]
MPAIALLVEPGSTPSSVALSLDIFRVADRFSADDPFSITLFSAAGGEVALSPSLHLETVPLPARLKGFDALILPGFFAADMQELSRKLETQWRPAIARLAVLDDTPLVAASCYGTFVLAESGLLEGRAATTTWWLREPFQQRYPGVRLNADRALVDDGRLITAGAMTAHTDLSHHLLRRLKGHAVARQVGSIMLVDEGRGSQLPFVALQRRFGEPLTDAAIAWMERHLAESGSARELAGVLHVSYRTLHRRFQGVTGMAPLAYLQALRVECAKELLETSRMGVEQIAGAVGYADTTSFRRLFTRLTSETPARYRRRFRRMEIEEATSDD